MSDPWAEFRSKQASAGDVWSDFRQPTAQGASFDDRFGALSDRAAFDAVQPPKREFGWGDTWPARAAKAIYSGLTLPGDVAQGNVSMTGPDGRTNPEVIDRSFELASVATPISPAAGTGAAIAASRGLGNPAKAPIPTREALFAASEQGYTKAREMGVDLSSGAITGLGNRIVLELNEKGVNGELAPKTFSILKGVTQAPDGAVATISNIDTIRRSLRHAANDFQNPTEQFAAQRAISALDDYMAAIPAQDVLRGDARAASRAISEARANYAAGKRSEQVTDAVERADLQAAAANSGQNIGNANRQRIKSIIASDKQSAGYSPQELEALENVVRGSWAGNALRTSGNLLGGGGGLGAAVVAGGAGAMTGGWGAALPLLGVAMKKGSDASVNKAIAEADALIRSRSPLAEALIGQGYRTQGVTARQEALARALLAGSLNQ